ncbi:Abi family protein [Maritimibacter sp. DP1N21-5]|uniref:Abi family protein n=1 Tax=Maritimibacter sp. DP1N21-5 TaxID=2836867 RepID=UPI001C491A69|nr:Abi family protein [Maritimibacter sp. DP1N21-5]
MAIQDHAKASEYLQRIGYYRLSAYWHPMWKRDPDTGRTIDEFVQGTTFKEATDLYAFDGRLRLLMLDALERIEVSLRTEVALCLGAKDPYAHRSLSNFGRDFARARYRGGATKHREWLNRLDDRAASSKDRFAEHFRTKYPSENMPIWIAVELLDFGPLSHLISGMSNKDLAAVGRSYGGLKPDQVKSWTRALAFTRNVCAHHSRLWNKPLVNQPSLAGNNIPGDLKHIQDRADAGTRLYSIAAVARTMLRSANPRTKWGERFVSHIQTFPDSPRLSIGSAGFPENWMKEPLWASRDS